jgi:hypothetical protein
MALLLAALIAVLSIVTLAMVKWIDKRKYG